MKAGVYSLVLKTRFNAELYTWTESNVLVVVELEEICKDLEFKVVPNTGSPGPLFSYSFGQDQATTEILLPDLACNKTEISKEIIVGDQPISFYSPDITFDA